MHRRPERLRHPELDRYQDRGRLYQRVSLRIKSSEGRPPDSKDWILENVQPTGNDDEFVSKLGDNFERTVNFDADGNGSYETPLKLFRDEMSFRHRRTNALISVSVLPMDQATAEPTWRYSYTTMSMRSPVAAAFPVSIGPGVAIGSQQRFATRVLDLELFEWAGEPAAGAPLKLPASTNAALPKPPLGASARRVQFVLPGTSTRWLRLARAHSFALHRCERVLHLPRNGLRHTGQGN